jgi:hypothetical protein
VLAKPDRLAGLDFAKGALVLLMVVYHWMNYFVGLDSDVYRYLRFLTPSFIFLTGFLVPQVYVARFFAGETHIPARIIRRGLKLLLIVLLLNAAAGLAGKRFSDGRAADDTPAALVWACLTGSAPVTFSVLVPISYLLILSAVLLILSRYIPHLFHAVSIATVGAAMIGDWNGTPNGYLELLGIGMLGVSAGHLSIHRVNRLVERVAWLVIAYVVYAGALILWNAVYALQVIGVCVNVALLYRLGRRTSRQQRVGGVLILLGQYSLFAYIIQIIIIRIVHSRVFDPGSAPDGTYPALFVTATCTLLSVHAVDRLRARASGINRLYTAIFA